MTTQAMNAVSPLDPFVPSQNDPWNKRKVLHVYRRLGFGATQEMIKDGLRIGPSRLIDRLIKEAVDKVPTPAPKWGFWTKDRFDSSSKSLFEYRNEWKEQMIKDCLQDGLRGRLTLFWSNHFVTEDRVYNYPSYTFQYYNILQLHAIGNFKEFTHDIGLNPAMLVYLNGSQNNGNHPRRPPNENYARELYELFTLGDNNGYTENDIKETARALTGWTDIKKLGGPILFDQDTFDNNPKTIFGQTGNWGYDDVIDILFKEKSSRIAKFICDKLYRYFVNPNGNGGVVRELSELLIEKRFNLAPVLRKLFKSKHFLSGGVSGIIIKSPTDLIIPFIKEVEFQYVPTFKIEQATRNNLKDLGQALLSPPDVSGWPGDKDWINSSTLPARQDFLHGYIDRAWRRDKEQFRTLAKNLVEEETKNPALITKYIVNHFLSRPLLNASEYNVAIDVFKDEVPENYFEDDLWDLEASFVPKQVYQLVKHIVSIPEFQLK
ncbi:DUF1800 domain-containing protein [Aquimarina algicola]|uniref:DUF1800 domain-containing protein n=1 Tax=Aquimarina algicola TaxID=2589995 RepID=A0A504J0Y1_9FLAO|nr:DUF1800 domain-containing protein [Aquimarina algicola]TPN81353.1 DUF1800 domain-containing protein [Aquimarina algicola]